MILKCWCNQRTKNVAWNYFDAKYFGLPQQKKVYVLLRGKDFFPENILFEKNIKPLAIYPNCTLKFKKDNHEF